MGAQTETLYLKKHNRFQIKTGGYREIPGCPITAAIDLISGKWKTGYLADIKKKGFALQRNQKNFTGNS